MTTINDGGPFPVDPKYGELNMNVCEQFTFSMEALPPFLTQIMTALPPLNGGWERTVTFTAGAQELQELVACCIVSSCAPNRERKFIIGIKIHWITSDGISKELRHQITKNSTTLRLLLKEIERGEFTQSKESAFFAASLSLRIQTIGEGKLHAISGALSEWPCELECPSKSLRDHFAGQALCGMLSDAANIAGVARLRGEESQPAFCAAICYNMADAMIAAREVKP